MSIIKKDYLTFGELCIKWGITAQDMHYLIAKGELVPSIAWNEYLVKCTLITYEKGEAEFLYPDPRSYIEKSGWLYLQLPKPTGHSSYSFRYAMEQLRPTDYFLSNETWYLLCNSVEYEGCFPPAQVPESYVAEECVFMMDSIADCELKHPELVELATRVSGALPEENEPELELSGLIDARKDKRGISLDALKLYAWPLGVKNGDDKLENALRRSDWLKRAVICKDPLTVNPALLAYALQDKSKNKQAGFFIPAKQLGNHLSENFPEYFDEYEQLISYEKDL